MIKIRQNTEIFNDNQLTNRRAGSDPASGIIVSGVTYEKKGFDYFFGIVHFLSIVHFLFYSQIVGL